MRRWRLLVTALLIPLAACGGDDGGGSGGSAGPAPLARVLRALPDDDDLLTAVDYVDYTAIRTVVGWDDDITFDEVEQFLPFINATRLLGAPAYGGAKFHTRAESSAELGFDPITMRTEVSVGSPPEAISDLAMSVDLDVATPVLDELGPEEDGIRRFDLDLSNDLAPILIGVNVLAVTDSRVVMASEDAGDLVPAVVDGDRVEGSLADAEDVRTVLGHLGDRPRVHLTSRFQDLDDALAGVRSDAERAQRRQELDVDAAPVEGRLFGLSMAFVDDDPERAAVTAVVLFADADDAEAASAWYEAVVADAASLRNGDPYEEFFDDFEATVNGTSVVMTWVAEISPFAMAATGDLPFLWHR